MKSKFFQKGFTLIELLIVIAIIGILAAVILVAINPGQRINASRNSRVRSDLTNMGSNAGVFNTDIGLAVPACTGGGSFPNAFVFAAPICGGTQTAITFNMPTAAANGYAMAVLPAGCAPNSANPCTSIAFSGPVLVDGVITQAQQTANPFFCWRSVTGTISQQSTAAQTPIVVPVPPANGSCNP